MYICTPERAPDLITDGCEPPCSCWELNSGPLEEQSVLLTSFNVPPLLSKGHWKSFCPGLILLYERERVVDERGQAGAGMEKHL